MRRLWVRRPPSASENAGVAAFSLLLGAAVGSVVFYFGRMLVARDRVDPDRHPDQRALAERGVTSDG